ncbi:MAG: transcription elongation factor [Aquaticitalea sp.]
MKIKQDLLQSCLDYANKRIANYKNELQTIKESIEDSDTGGGEDDDSGNSKLLSDLEKNSQHLSEANKMLNGLKDISAKTVSDKVILGSVVKTTSNNFFISVSAGKIDIGDGSYFAISQHSPIGMLLMGKSKDATIEFNGNKFTITEVI